MWRLKGDAGLEGEAVVRQAVMAEGVLLGVEVLDAKLHQAVQPPYHVAESILSLS